MFPYGEIIEFLCLLSALYFLRGQDRALWTYMKIYLAFVLLLELSSVWLHRTGLSIGWLYHISLPIQTLFPGFVLYQHLNGKFFKRTFEAAALVFLLVFASGIWNSGLRYSFATDMVGSILLVYAAGAFFYDLLQSEETVRLLRYPPYWLAAGILLFNSGSIVCTVFAQIMGTLYLGSIPLWNLLFTVLTLILCLCWVNAFRCQHRAYS